LPHGNFRASPPRPRSVLAFLPSAFWPLPPNVGLISSSCAATAELGWSVGLWAVWYTPWSMRVRGLPLVLRESNPAMGLPVPGTTFFFTLSLIASTQHTSGQF